MIPPRITFVLSSLEAGGAERVAAILTAEWAARGWPVTLLTFDDGTIPPFYKPHPEIDHQPLALRGVSPNIAASIVNNGRRLRRLRQALCESRPDLIVSFGDTTNVLALIASRMLGVPIVVTEHVDPERHPIGWAWQMLRRLTYPCADTVTVLTERMGRHFPYARRVAVVPNPIVPPAPGNHAAITLKQPAVVGVGRLQHQKRFSLLIDVFAALARRYPDWTLYIFGEGPLRGPLAAQIAKHDLTDRIMLPGIVAPLDGVLQQADLFVLSSAYEGFPMSLCEAMANGVAVISTDCPTGPREIIRDGVDGILVRNDDATALEGAMRWLMADSGKRAALAGKGPQIIERFGTERIFALWDDILLSGSSLRPESVARP